jgi:hypothetical protein
MEIIGTRFSGKFGDVLLFSPPLPTPYIPQAGSGLQQKNPKNL